MKRKIAILLIVALILSFIPAIIVNAADATVVYQKISSMSELTTGKYVLVAGNGYAPKALDGTWLSSGTPAVNGGAISAADAAGFIWDITVDGTSVKLTDANGVTVAPKGGNNNGVIEGDYQWAWSFESDGTFKFAGAGSDTVVLASNATTTGQYPGNHRFRGYKTSTVNGNPSTYPYEFTMYKLGGEYVEPEVTEPEPEVTEPEAAAEPSAQAVELVNQINAVLETFGVTADMDDQQIKQAIYAQPWSVQKPTISQIAQIEALAEELCGTAETAAEEAAAATKKYVCGICCYEYEGESLPADYVCPLCKCGPEEFTLAE